MPPRDFEAKHGWMECEDSAKPPPFRLVMEPVPGGTWSKPQKRVRVGLKSKILDTRGPLKTY